MSLLNSAIFIFVLHLSWVYLTAAFNCSLPGWSWASNSLGLDPCAVSEQLQTSCLGSAQVLSPIQGTSQVYGGPNVAGPPCQCNTVVYSTLQACAACQNGTIVSWSNYSKSCQSVTVSFYPPQIPDGTRIPHWAYINVTITDMFSAAAASSVGDQPEATPILTSSSTITSSTISSATGSQSPTSTPSSSLSSASAPPSQAPSKSSNTGAIVGGTVGGIAGAGLIGAILLYLFRRRRASTSYEIASSFGGKIVLKPYDPDDPTTFPTSSGETMDEVSANALRKNVGGRGGYRGHAEF